MTPPAAIRVIREEHAVMSAVLRSLVLLSATNRRRGAGADGKPDRTFEKLYDALLETAPSF